MRDVSFDVPAVQSAIRHLGARFDGEKFWEFFDRASETHVSIDVRGLESLGLGLVAAHKSWRDRVVVLPENRTVKR